LTARDEVKFVLADRADYDWAREVLLTHSLAAPVLLSPVHDELPAAQLADWILADCLAVRLQVQLHKVLWGSVAGK
jgi:7-carboxy-7-deazaguanine synthase